MPRKVIAFDLDGTLAPSKSPVPDRMVAALDGLLEHYHVLVMSGGKFEQFQKQLLSSLKVEPAKLERLHLMPTCGTRYYHYDVVKGEWVKVYAEDFTADEKAKIIDALQKVVAELGYVEKKTYGEIIEDRGSQITWSVLGQDIVDALGEEGLRLKEAWDPDNAKKNKVRDAAALLLPEFEVRVGGITSVDITRPGIDKGYGMQKLLDMMEIGKDEVIFIGDRLKEGGNDYPVKAMGVDCMEISYWHETALAVEAIVAVA